MKPLVHLQCVAKRFGETRIFEDISFDVHVGRHLALLGASGCGKTTLLRLIAGLDAPNDGEIALDGRPVSSAGRILVEPHERQLAMVFQDLALWPNLTALQNVLLGMAQARLRRAERRRQALAALRACRLEHLANRRPEALSAGQQQRVALARAVAVRPKLLLLDEPFSGLDPIVKGQIFAEISALCATFAVTILLVTHDVLEASALCCEAVVIEDGAVREQGALEGLLERPTSSLLSAFVRQIFRQRAD